MKRTMYFLLALLVALTLVVGVSCNGDNKTPEDEGYTEQDLGTDKINVPEWLYGTFKGSLPLGENGDPVEVTVVFSKDNIKVDAEGILPSSIKILNQSFIGYNYFLEYELGDGDVRVIHARKQNSQLLEVSYSVGGEEVVTDSPFTIVEQSQ